MRKKFIAAINQEMIINTQTSTLIQIDTISIIYLEDKMYYLICIYYWNENLKFIEFIEF